MGLYNNTYRLYYYSKDYFRLINFNKREEGFEKKPLNPVSDGFNVYDLSEYKFSFPLNRFTNKEECERISRSRAKRNIKEICLCNDFKYFVTLTINSDNADRFSLEECQKLLKRLLKNYAKKFKYNTNIDFKYIIVTEKHKNGAFHFHGLFSDLLQKDIYKNNYGYISSHFFDTKLGFCSFSEIKDSIKCANYITKYITKDSIKNNCNQLYFCSKGLKRATIIDFDSALVNERNTLDSEFWTYSNEFCKLKDFYFDSLSDLEKDFFFNIL